MRATITINLPLKLLLKIEEIAEKEGKSRSKVISLLIEKALKEETEERT